MVYVMFMIYVLCFVTSFMFCVCVYILCYGLCFMFYAYAP